LTRLRIVCDYQRESIVEGASIACAGVCVTVVAIGGESKKSWFEVDAAAETLTVTTVGHWRVGRKINLERPLKLGDELGGHMVAGHVDGLATLAERQDLNGMARLVLRTRSELARFIAPKGSLALDGVSLTINEVMGDSFSVLIIPHSLKVTTLGALAPGDEVNLEVDRMARYAARLIETR
jgi:riboflavin synthase